jgi:hypothetical protein
MTFYFKCAKKMKRLRNERVLGDILVLKNGTRVQVPSMQMCISIQKTLSHFAASWPRTRVAPNKKDKLRR